MKASVVHGTQTLDPVFSWDLVGKRGRAGQAWSDASSECSSVAQGLKLAPKSLLKTPCLDKHWRRR